MNTKVTTTWLPAFIPLSPVPIPSIKSLTDFFTIERQLCWLSHLSYSSLTNLQEKFVTDEICYFCYSKSFIWVTTSLPVCSDSSFSFLIFHRRAFLKKIDLRNLLHPLLRPGCSAQPLSLGYRILKNYTPSQPLLDLLPLLGHTFKYSPEKDNSLLWKPGAIGASVSASVSFCTKLRWERENKTQYKPEKHKNSPYIGAIITPYAQLYKCACCLCHKPTEIISVKMVTEPKFSIWLLPFS